MSNPISNRTNTSTANLGAFHLGLALALAGLSVWAAIRPLSRGDWFMENILVWVAVVVIASLRHRIRLSRTAYLLIACFLAMQVYGSHYSYLPEIGNWVSSVFRSPRNSFDRVMHLAFGLLMFVPAMECLENGAHMSRRTAMVVAVLALTAFGAAYEIIEWSSMVVLNPEASAVFVGLQGDPWDAQKDMALGLLGSVVSFIAVWFRATRRAHHSSFVSVR